MRKKGHKPLPPICRWLLELTLKAVLANVDFFDLPRLEKLLELAVLDDLYLAARRPPILEQQDRE